ncbi:metallophosphoesterase [Stieleria sp. ICT_E10.1]|uniref:metallophosphoesterase family protein n=1 Tax=Stieleria sedimenti TaxID=2976331 RepID=UPI00217F5CC0|nr:metallophosphoesterase [Stieleria sedimenti]MCS7466420.1 metallophosphoesterase [Stieleria sedimenti]
MRITSIQPELIREISFLNAGRGPGGFYRDSLPVHRGFVDALPEGMSAIIATADLQGRETFESAGGKQLRLLGEVLPAILCDEILPNLGLADGRIGVLLAGDFYTVPALDKRGGSGDVTPVWRAFADEFGWIVGVAGNHDLFGDAATRPRFTDPIHFLDNDTVTVDELPIAGLSGIPGNPRRPWRRTEDDFVEALKQLLCDSPAIVVMHDGPDVPDFGFRGSPRMRESIESSEPTLIVRGHAHWKEPLATLSNGTQVLNVDARVVILTSKTS